MIYSRETHWKFLEQELAAQTEAFKQKLETSATYLLLDKEELFVAQFIKIEDGELMLRFSNTRGIPRQGEYLYCFTVPKAYRNYREWGNMTYGDLIKSKHNYTEAICIWQSPSDEKEFSIVGFRGIDAEFAEDMKLAESIIILLGPNKPPYEYIANLQKIVQKSDNPDVDKILDHNFNLNDTLPVPIDSKKSITDFVLSQLSLQDTAIIQGPPGTGKTHLIAEIVETLCRENKTVLVTALTNRALIEIASKDSLKQMLKEKRVLKTKISVDEIKLLPELESCKEIAPQKAKVILSTFFIASSAAVSAGSEPPFDYVIVDEASQAILGMIAAAKVLGEKVILIGDVMQLPPVTAISDDIINRYEYHNLVDGLKAISGTGLLPYYQLTETHRLSQRAANYTSKFYNTDIKSKVTNLRKIKNDLPIEVGKYFHPEGGPTLIKTDLPIGELRPRNALIITTELVAYLLKHDRKLNISVLTYFIDTTKALQKTIYQTVGYHKNLLIETVSRVQGLTTDICIFVVPNSGYHRSLENRLFNVATSRSKLNTIIIADKNVIANGMADNFVLEYLKALDEEFSFTIIPDKSVISIQNE
jgi:DNA replication ATP-dependent helicase Dna2